MNVIKKVIEIKKDALSVVVLVAGVLFLFEITWRILEVWFPPRPMDIGLGFTPDSKVFVVDPSNSGFMMTNPSKTGRVFQPARFSRKKEVAACRIFAVGGSSVNYLDSEFHVLEKRLEGRFRERFSRVEIINAGGLSYGSQRLVLVVAEILKYEPDLVLLYSGHNEFEEIQQFQFASLKTIWLQTLVSKSAFLRTLRDRVTDVAVSKIRWEHNKRILMARDRPNFVKARKFHFTMQDVRARMENYRNNLSLIIESCRKNKVPVIIGTVPSNLVKPYIPELAWGEYAKVQKLLEGRQYPEAVQLGRTILRNTPGRHQSSDLENDIIRSLAEKYHCPLADVEKEIVLAEPHNVPGMALFHDHCHLNEKGNTIWIHTYEPLIDDVLK
jgi:hypothetical protein